MARMSTLLEITKSHTEAVFCLIDLAFQAANVTDDAQLLLMVAEQIHSQDCYNCSWVCIDQILGYAQNAEYML